MLFMKGKDNVARPVSNITRLRNNNFLTEVTRYLVKMWLVIKLPNRKPRKPRVQTRLMVCVLVCRLYARKGCMGPVMVWMAPLPSSPIQAMQT